MTVSQNYYKLYIDAVVELASTIVIKSDYTADAINTRLNQLYGIVANPVDKTTWKYYLNISGNYHPTDEIIEITSLDDLAKITFDRQTLLNHPATLEAYKFGTRYYRELVTLHPEMQQFILGCLYPSNINKAIQAEDGSVLCYPEYLIETNEESLISNIELWIKNFKSRWYNKQFNESDNLYAATNLGIMYLNLVPLILNLRLKACMTREAHSFHIRQFLASHGYLDIYLDQLNLKQKLFLYRNIRYIERNNGRVEIFEWLVQKLMTDRNLPLAEYTMRHDVNSLESTYYSTPGFRRKDLTNVFSPKTAYQPVIDIDELLRRETPLAQGNEEFIFDTRDQINKKFQNSLSSVVATKVLESSVIDYTDSEAYALAEVRLGHWLKNSAEGLYSAFVTFKDPITSVEKTLTAFDAYLYWFYCYCSSMQINLIDLPKLLAYKVVRTPKPTTAQLRALIDSTKVSDTEINRLINTVPDLISTNSVSGFADLVSRIYSAYKKQQIIVSAEETYFKRGMLEAVSDYLYENKEYTTSEILQQKDGVTYLGYSDWLASRGISTLNYTREMFETVHMEIFRNATGGDYYTTKELGALQKAMVKLLTQLSSYSIQILTEINARNIRKLGWSAIRPGERKDLEKAKHDVLALTTYVQDVVTAENAKYKIAVMPVAIKTTSTVSVKSKERLEIPVKVNPSKTKEIKNYIIRLGTIVINHSFVNPTAPGAIKNLTGYDSFLSLTDEQKLTIKDVYHNVFENNLGLNKISTSLAILRNYLPGFSNLTLVRPILKSFEYNLIPTESYIRIRTAVNQTLKGILPNIGKIDLNAYSLFVGNTYADLFKFFAKKNTMNAFKFFGLSVNAHASYIQDKLEFGPQLSAFTYGANTVQMNAYSYIKDERDIPNMSYSSEHRVIDFIKQIMGKATVQHPNFGGSLVDAFHLVSNGGQTTYNIVGFTYNGNQIIWS